jgi:hypothetical protein
MGRQGDIFLPTTSARCDLVASTAASKAGSLQFPPSPYARPD